MAVELIVPWKPGCEYRERAWHWLRDRYEAGGWDVVEASSREGPWCKATAAMPAIKGSSAEIVAVVDADCWTDGIGRAVHAVASGSARWAVPHEMLFRLDEESTRAFMAGEPGPRTFTQRPEAGIWGGGIVVGERDAFLEAPLDARFTSWGQEDQAWALALSAICGRGWRGTAPLWHLYHPPQERLSRNKGSRESWSRYLRYRKASQAATKQNDLEPMRELLEEARCPSPA